MACQPKIKRFIVDVLVVPSKLETMLGTSQVRYEKKSVYGISRSDALQKSGIK
jgi:hypothetical protein